MPSSSSCYFWLLHDCNLYHMAVHASLFAMQVGETGASCYRGRLLQGHFMQNYYIDGEIADSSSMLIH